MSESIVVGTDGSDTAKLAVEEAVRLAKALGAEVHIVSAFKPLRTAHVGGEAGREYQALPHDKVDSTLSEAEASARTRGVSVKTHALERDPIDALLEVAEKESADLLVVGSKGMHGARRLTLGNVPNQISHRARCNVLIVATDRVDAATPTS